MKRATTVPPAIRAAFLAALQPESAHAAALPDPLPMDQVLRLTDKNSGSTELIRVKAGHDGKAYFLDYYRVDNDGQTSWHARIHEDGRIEKLENIEGQLGRRVFPDPEDTKRDLQRIVAHNDQTREVLRKKGFL
jgi:hypothetical protein